MEKYMELISTTRNQYLVIFGISIAIMILTGILYVRNAPIFRLFFGAVNPLLAIFSISVLGILLLTLMLSRGWFTIREAGDVKGMLFASVMAGLLGLVIILVDLKAVFPMDTNRPFPDSLCYYPVFGFVVEIIFHLLPLSLLLLVLTSLFMGLSYENTIWPCILIVAFLEPVFQTALSSSKPYAPWLVGYVFLHIFIINFIELLIFKRHDFISMYIFRLVYYFIWHIAWGHARLDFLF